MKPVINKATSDPVYFAFNHVEGGSQLTIQNGTDADLTVEVTNQDAQRLGVGGVVWSSPAQGDIVIAAGGNATLLAPYAFVRLSGSGVGGIYIAYVEKDDEDNLPVYATPSSATLYASFVNEIYYISGDYVDFDTALDITRSSSKWVWGTGAQTGQLVEVPPNTPAYQHDPVTGAPLGLSVEGSATNLMTLSGNLSTYPSAGWSNFIVSSAGSGVPSADTFVNVVNANGFLGEDSIIRAKAVAGERASSRFNLSVTAGVTYTVSLYFDVSRCVFSGNVNDRIFIALGQGVDERRSASDISDDGVVAATFTPSTTGTLTISFGVGAAGGAIENQDLYYCLWQVEVGNKATSRIPTTTSTVTRAADIVTSDAATFGDWFSSSEGTFVVEFEAVRLNAVDYVIDQRGGSSTNGVVVFFSSSITARLSSNGTNYSINLGAFNDNEKYKVEISFNGVTFKARLNGGAVQSIPATNPSSFNQEIKLGTNNLDTVTTSIDFKSLTFQGEATL